MEPHWESPGGAAPILRPDEPLSRLDRLYRSCVNIPDDKVGWRPFALRGAGRTARAFRPDLIYASSPPPTGLVAAACLARRLAVPWVAEIRDRWADDPHGTGLPGIDPLPWGLLGGESHLPDGRFGDVLDSQGEVLLIGAPYASQGGAQVGGVYVFPR